MGEHVPTQKGWEILLLRPHFALLGQIFIPKIKSYKFMEKIYLKDVTTDK